MNLHLDPWNRKKAIVELLLDSMLGSELCESSFVHGITVLLTLLQRIAVQRPRNLALQHSAPVLNHLAPAPSYCALAYTSIPWLFAALLSLSATPLGPGSKLLCPGLHFHSMALRCSTLAQCYTTWPRPTLPLRGSTLLYSAPVLHHLAPAPSYCAPAYTSPPWLYAAQLCPSATPLDPGSTQDGSTTVPQPYVILPKPYTSLPSVRFAI
ncbi:hypothetical protein OUZ56_021864 [Daphnia magna]|uniref:Uncharacterized protein n=1 Tax=Daphnia magna TaxID=35525 RepID=A0ABR0AUS7_9CRUS|nr:hypothetical protein OUZ56_021864 [Daphnia magna]